MTLKARFKEWFASLFYLREGYDVPIYSEGKVWPMGYYFESRREAIDFARNDIRLMPGEYVTVEAVFSGHPPITIYDSRRDV